MNFPSWNDQNDGPHFPEKKIGMAILAHEAGLPVGAGSGAENWLMNVFNYGPARPLQPRHNPVNIARSGFDLWHAAWKLQRALRPIILYKAILEAPRLLQIPSSSSSWAAPQVSGWVQSGSSNPPLSCPPTKSWWYEVWSRDHGGWWWMFITPAPTWWSLTSFTKIFKIT